MISRMNGPRDARPSPAELEIAVFGALDAFLRFGKAQRSRPKGAELVEQWTICIPITGYWRDHPGYQLNEKTLPGTSDQAG
jgi:hypothetical protein